MTQLARFNNIVNKHLSHRTRNISRIIKKPEIFQESKQNIAIIIFFILFSVRIIAAHNVHVIHNNPCGILEPSKLVHEIGVLGRKIWQPWCADSNWGKSGMEGAEEPVASKSRHRGELVRVVVEEEEEEELKLVRFCAGAGWTCFSLLTQWVKYPNHAFWLAFQHNLCFLTESVCYCISSCFSGPYSKVFFLIRLGSGF